MHQIYPKELIRSLFIDEIRDISIRHPYLSFGIICSGIEFLGKCINIQASWNDDKHVKENFEKAIGELFPKHYKTEKEKLYKQLRCGMAHSLTPGTYKLTELKNDPIGALNYQNHLKTNKEILVIEYFYFDFAEACSKVLAMKFPKDNKMNKPITYIGPLNQSII